MIFFARADMWAGEQALGVPLHAVRVLTRRMGGAFGGKASSQVPPACLPAAPDLPLSLHQALLLPPPHPLCPSIPHQEKIYFLCSVVYSTRP